MRQRKIGVRLGSLNFYPVGSGEVFETEEFSGSALAPRGPHPSTARQPSGLGELSRALGKPEAALGFLALGLGPDAERGDQNQGQSTADGAQGAPHPSSSASQDPEDAPGRPGLLGAQGLCGCQGGRLLPLPVA